MIEYFPKSIRFSVLVGVAALLAFAAPANSHEGIGPHVHVSDEDMETKVREIVRRVHTHPELVAEHNNLGRSLAELGRAVENNTNTLASVVTGVSRLDAGVAELAGSSAEPPTEASQQNWIGYGALVLALVALAWLAAGFRGRPKIATDQGGKAMPKSYHDLDVTDSLGRLGDDVSFVAKQVDGGYIIRIRSSNHKILLESQNKRPYTLDEAEEHLAEIYDAVVAGNARRVRKPPTDREEDEADSKG